MLRRIRFAGAAASRWGSPSGDEMAQPELCCAEDVAQCGDTGGRRRVVSATGDAVELAAVVFEQIAGLGETSLAHRPTLGGLRPRDDRICAQQAVHDCVRGVLLRARREPTGSGQTTRDAVESRGLADRCGAPVAAGAGVAVVTGAA